MVQPDFPPQATYTHTVQDRHTHSPQLATMQQQQALSAAPVAVSAAAADISKVESWLRAVGRARGWDLKLLDDLLAQDLAAVLASDCPRCESSTGVLEARHTPVAPMHARSNPLALQEFVSECAGRPRSGGRRAGTADTLVTAVHKHLLRRSGTTATHQHADLLRQSFDLLERGAASRISDAYKPASLRQDVLLRSTTGIKYGSTSEDLRETGVPERQSDRSESFPGFQPAGEMPQPLQVLEQTPRSNGGTVDANSGRATSHQEPIVVSERDLHPATPAERACIAARTDDTAGTACGVHERSRRKRRSGRGNRQCSMPGQLQLDADVVTTGQSGVGALEGDTVRRPVQPWKGVQVASSKRPLRGKAPRIREQVQLGPMHERLVPVPSPGGTDWKVHKLTSAHTSTSYLASALRQPGSAPDTDVPLLKLARRVTVHSYRYTHT